MKVCFLSTTGQESYTSARNAARMVALGLATMKDGVLVGAGETRQRPVRGGRLDAEDNHTVTRSGILYEFHFRRSFAYGR